MKRDPHQCSDRYCHDLDLKNIAAHYQDKQALEGVEMTLSCGHRLAILGPNGAGKSTLIKMLAGLKRPSAGHILWRGEPLQQWSREVAYLPQSDHHQENFPITVKEVVEMGRYPHLGFWRRFRSRDADQVQEAMKIMEILDLEHRQIDELSGGQRQRVFIARALAQEAHVILLDEPFNGLDVESRIHLAHTLKMLTERGHLIIASHHDLETVTQLFDHALVLDGRQIAFGKAEEVMKSEEVLSLFHCHHYETQTHL